jgi:disulfide bond formation protein DsbB
MFVKRNKISVFFWIGAILILVGIILSVYVDSVIKMHEEKLFFGDLLEGPEKWALEGSYEWWRMARITIYDPLSIISIAVGLVALIYSFILAIQHRPARLPSSQTKLVPEQAKIDG